MANGQGRPDTYDAGQILDGSTAEAGWDGDSRISVLLAFIDAEAENDRLMYERFQAFLDERVTFEQEGE